MHILEFPSSNTISMGHTVVCAEASVGFGSTGGGAPPVDVRHRRCSGARPPFLLRAAASPARWPSPRGRGGERGATSGANSLAENSWSPLRHAPVASAHPWLSCAAAVIGVSPGSLSSPRAAGKHRRGTRSAATVLRSCQTTVPKPHFELRACTGRQSVGVDSPPRHQ